MVTGVVEGLEAVVEEEDQEGRNNNNTTKIEMIRIVFIINIGNNFLCGDFHFTFLRSY